MRKKKTCWGRYWKPVVSCKLIFVWNYIVNQKVSILTSDYQVFGLKLERQCTGVSLILLSKHTKHKILGFFQTLFWNKRKSTSFYFEILKNHILICLFSQNSQRKNNIVTDQKYINIFKLTIRVQISNTMSLFTQLFT